MLMTGINSAFVFPVKLKVQGVAIKYDCIAVALVTIFSWVQNMPVM